ncbi:unnamed protein product [Victoria cruziana]
MIRYKRFGTRQRENCRSVFYFVPPTVPYPASPTYSTELRLRLPHLPFLVSSDSDAFFDLHPHRSGRRSRAERLLGALLSRARHPGSCITAPM